MVKCRWMWPLRALRQCSRWLAWPMHFSVPCCWAGELAATLMHVQLLRTYGLPYRQMSCGGLSILCCPLGPHLTAWHAPSDD